MKWNKFIKDVSSGRASFFEEIVGKSSVTHVDDAKKQWTSTGSESELISRLHAAADSERRELLLSHLQKRLSKVLGRESLAGELGRGFMDLGVDSLMSIEFRNKLKKELGDVFGKSLPPTLLYDYPNLNELVDFLLRDIIRFEKISVSKVKKEKKKIGSNEPIAIIGAACRLPGGVNDLDSYWTLLKNGVDAIQTIPEERWDAKEFFDVDPDAAGKIVTQLGGFLKDVDKFDAQFFDMSAHEASEIDPQQRMLLETSWEALELAGENPENLRGSRTGVYIGCMNYDYARLHSELHHRDHGGFFAIGTLPPAMAGRLSYFFGFQGPSSIVDTACSSSLLAIHQACKGLREGEADMALAGGVNLILTPDISISTSHAGMLSPDGHCFTFDDRANGYVRSEGCGIVILKRLSDALENGDRILAVVRGSATNQDGRSSGFTAPSGPAQEALIRESLSVAGIQPSEVSYFEAHGTGTPLGDPIEVNSLGRVLREGRNAENPLTIGSAKASIGHTEAAAGVAGVIKLTLALQSKQIPPHVNFKKLNPKIILEDIPAKIETRLTPWTPKYGKRIASISGYGATGTNVNAVLEEAPPIKLKLNPNSIERPQHILCLSGKNEEALNDLVVRYLEFFKSHSICCRGF